VNFLSAWPALASAEPLPPLAEYERAVWGKVHGAPTDFRWIARSASFGRERADLPLQLNLGGEDAPASFSAWRSLGDRCYAVAGYPSRARDAAGRLGFLEKQVLEWQRPAHVPAALAALLLLPHAALLTDAVWWDRCAGNMLTESEMFLPIAPTEQEPLLFDEDEIGVTIERGRQQLRETVSRDALSRLYSQLLSGERPALLGGVRQPLGAEALAVLLLPLPREMADRLSLSGWLPAQRPAWGDLGARWDVIATPLEASQALHPSFEEQATRMAEMLLATESAPSRQTTAPPPPRAISTVAPRRPAPLRPGHRLDLTSPAAGAPQILVQLHAFASAVDRRWLLPAGRARMLDSSAATQIASWIRELRAQQPDYVHATQWSIKCDLLRSAALVLVPEARTVELVGVPDATSPIPSLFFGAMLERPNDLAKLDAATLRLLLAQSVQCPAPRSVRKPFQEWLQSWRKDAGRSAVSALIGDALASPSR
jgi:hypothetical protein